MPSTRPPYPQEFRRQIIDLVRAGRTPRELAREFKPTYETIHAWVHQADRDEGQIASGKSGVYKTFTVRVFSSDERVWRSR